MPYDYFVRITHPYETLAPMVSLWAMRCEKLVVYEHTGSKTEKVHCHILVLGSNTQKKQLRNIGSQIVDLKGNENCSFKECISWETPVVYMTKGNLAPSYLKGFTEAEAIQWSKKWVPRAEFTKPNKELELYLNIMEDENAPLEISAEDKVNEEFAAFRKVVRHARKWIFFANQDVWNGKCLSQYKMCVYTYCMRHQIPIPNNEWSKWL